MSLSDIEMIFGAFTNLFVLGWACLFISVFTRTSSRLRHCLLMIGGRIVPLALLSMFVVGWLLTRDLPGDITTLNGVLLGFTVPEKVILAWFEILGLALIVGHWMIVDGIDLGVPKPVVAISLVGAFFAVAIGLIAYLVMTRAFSLRAASS